MAKQERRAGESIDSMLRKFKRKLKNEGTIQELKSKEYYEKPSDAKKRRKKAAKKRTITQQDSEKLI